MLHSFHFHGFRGGERSDLTFGKKTYIEGNNGSGKTHILEAIHLLCQGELHYPSFSLSDGAYFEAYWQDGYTGLKHFSRGRNGRSDVYQIQKQKVTRKRYYEDIPFHTVFVSPFDMNLLYFSPSVRRDYIDSILDQKYEQFSLVKRSYDQIVRQRNALLKNIREGISQIRELDYWDDAFIEKALIYHLYRDKLYTYFQEHFKEVNVSLQKYHLSFVPEVHETVMGGKEDMRSYLEKNRQRDILTGHTHIGPHRDDFGIHVRMGEYVGGAEAILSRGEMKLLLLSLKLLEVNLLTHNSKKHILLLVDDIFAELDEENIRRFLKTLTPYQTILTSQKSLPNEENWSEFTCINLKDS